MDNYPKYTDSIDTVLNIDALTNEINTGKVIIYNDFSFESHTVVRKIVKSDNELILIGVGFIKKNDKKVKKNEEIQCFNNNNQYGLFVSHNQTTFFNYPISLNDGRIIYGHILSNGECPIIKTNDGVVVTNKNNWAMENNCIQEFCNVKNIKDVYTFIDMFLFFYRNIIISGAPGTGKSYIVQEKIIPKILECNSSIKLEECVERIIFTSSTSYEDFFGCYKPKPIMDNGEHSITYEFVPGVFSVIIDRANKNPQNNYVLVIEEINRADVYDVFGQIFQLLDRQKNNSSEYSISVPADAKEYFWGQDKLSIPSNLFIVCTMNAADQGVRLLDTAFKRRFSMVHVDIKGQIYASSKVPFISGTPNLITSKSKLTKEQYHNIRKNINEVLLKEKMTEDKLIAEYFLKTDNDGVEDIDFIVNILGYLLQNVYKGRTPSERIFEVKENGIKVNNAEINLYKLLKLYNGNLENILVKVLFEEHK